MPDSIEQRLEDLERLVLQQADRIAALEEQAALAQRLAASRVLREFRRPEDAAA